MSLGLAGSLFQAPSDMQILRLGAQANLGTAPESKQDKSGIAPIKAWRKSRLAWAASLGASLNHGVS
jgi:hypothetical protein